MILDTTSKTLEVVLGAAHTTNALEINSDWADTASGATFVPGSTPQVTNGTTAVTAVAAPAASTQRHVKSFSVYNSDTVEQTVTVRTYDGTNRRRIISTIIPVGACLTYTDHSGWKVFPDATAVYSSGVWTPVDASGAALTFTGVDASWIKVGKMVMAQGTITFPSTANGSNNVIGGLPFTVKNTQGVRFGGFVASNKAAIVSIISNPNANTFTLRDSSLSVMTNAAFSGIALFFTIMYESV